MNRITPVSIFVTMIISIISVNVLALVNDTEIEINKNWYFAAYLDDKEIGHHSFEVTSRGNRIEVQTRAEFDVRFMFISFYNYQHTNSEVWSEGCLVDLKSRTVDDGEELFVTLTEKNSSTSIETLKGAYSSTNCIRSFAYWSPHLLNASTLLNSQTGELIDITYETYDFEEILLNNQLVNARKVRLLGEDKSGQIIDISVWYDQKDQWLALQSMLANERMLRYELKQGYTQ